MALDKVSAAMMSPLSVSETAPSNPTVGQRWYRASTAVTYQYTNDGTSSFWLDVSSSGIGTSASRGVDFVGDIDPIATTNGTGLAIGSVYYNRENNRHFVCTTATTNANVWSGRYNAAGGTVTDYLLSGTYYRVHTFLGNGTFAVEDAMNVDILIIAGGGGGGNGHYNQGEGGGGGAGGVKYFSQKTLAYGSHTVTVGLGGNGSTNADISNVRGLNGVASSVGSLSTTGGGGGGSRSTNIQTGVLGGSGGGGGQRDDSTANHGAGTANQGNNGGSGFEGAQMSGGGGGGAGAIGTSSTTTGVGGAGGAGIVEGTTSLYDWTLANGTTATFNINGTTNSYAGGGGGGGQTTPANGQHGGGNGATSGEGGTDGTANTGGGGGGQGGNGGSGIVVIRYAI